MGSAINPMIGIPAAAGFVSKRFADRATKKNLDELVHLLATGAPKPKAKDVSPKNRDLIARFLMSGAVVGAEQ
jgi:hypothetical protein